MLDPSERIIVLHDCETGHEIEAQLDKELTSYGGRAAWRIRSAFISPYVRTPGIVYSITTIVVERKV